MIRRQRHHVLRTCFENGCEPSKGATGGLSASVLGRFSATLADKQPVAPFQIVEENIDLDTWRGLATIDAADLLLEY